MQQPRGYVCQEESPCRRPNAENVEPTGRDECGVDGRRLTPVRHHQLDAELGNQIVQGRKRSPQRLILLVGRGDDGTEPLGSGDADRDQLVLIAYPGNGRNTAALTKLNAVMFATMPRTRLPMTPRENPGPPVRERTAKRRSRLLTHERSAGCALNLRWAIRGEAPQR